MSARKDRLWIQSKGKCHWCGCEMVRLPSVIGQPDPPNLFTEDHVIPRALGGTKVVASCRRCNAERGEQFSREFQGYSNFLRQKLAVAVGVDMRCRLSVDDIVNLPCWLKPLST